MANKKIEIKLTKDEINELIEYYKDHTGKSTCNKFNISITALNKILSDNYIEKHDVYKVKQLSINEGTFKIPPSTKGKHHYNDGVKNYFVTDNEAKKLNLFEGFIKMSDEKIKERQVKTEETNLKRYGVKQYNNREKSVKTYNENIHFKSYWYNGVSFDSSWELALWIYAKDHNEDIVRSPGYIEYYVNDNKYKYYPDFKYKDYLIEIKGDHLYKDNLLGGCYVNCSKFNLDRAQAKTNCMLENNVKLYLKKDIQFALDYVNKTYGKNYLKSFKITNKN